MTFHRTLHPYFSLFTSFDYRYKRLSRFAFVLGQTSVITILLWICYSQIFIDAGLTESMGEKRPYYVSLVLSLLTLPLPRRCCCCFKTQMYLLKENVEDDGAFDEEEENKGLNKPAN